MPTIHYLTERELKLVGEDMTMLEHQAQKEIIEKTGKAPTRDEIHDYIKKAVSGSDASDDGGSDHEETNNNDNTLTNETKSRSDSLSSLPKHHERAPVFVKCGNKQVLYDAWELTGPGVEYKKGHVYVEWATSGRKEFVLESDVIRGDLEPRRRKKTERFVDLREEKPRRKKAGVKEATDFLPINGDEDDSLEDDHDKLLQNSSPS